jgi:protein gp37
VFSVMSDIDRHTYQVLTKRPERMVQFYIWQAARTGFEWMPSNNVWIGVSVEDQETFEERIVKLMQCAASVRFLSCEPLLGSIDLRKHFYCGGGYAPLAKYIDWVIIGGESGHKARPVHPDWVRQLIIQCLDYETPVYFKQWGEWMPLNRKLVSDEIALLNGKDKALHADGMHYLKVGKKKSGRMLDGQEYNEFPRAYKGGE